MTDGEGNVYTYTYDLAGNLTSETDPKGNKTTYRYDKDHNLVEKINSLGDSTRYYYDGVGHLVQTYTYREVSWPSSGSNRRVPVRGMYRKSTASVLTMTRMAVRLRPQRPWVWSLGMNMMRWAA